MRKNRKVKTAELLYLLNNGPDVGNPAYRRRYRLWAKTHVFPFIESLIPESREMIDRFGETEQVKRKGYFCRTCQATVAGVPWNGTGYTQIICADCGTTLDRGSLQVEP